MLALTLTSEERGVLEHACAWNRRCRYRNHYVSAPDCDTWQACCALRERGLLRQQLTIGGTTTFVVTELGFAALRKEAV